MQFTKRVTDVLWDGDFKRSRVPIHIQIKKTFLTYVGNVFFYVRDRNPEMQDYKFSASANLFAVFPFAFSIMCP